jgi:MoaA/NifB/PqqE/SkfB family radical SAM enzyme
MRLDAVPYNRGWVRVRRIGTCHVDDRSPESLKALRWQLKQETRAGVEQSEATGRYRLPHMPESISLELTAGCNLTCSHCSSHGLAKEHARNNRRKPFDLAMLDRLAADAFPALTLLNLVGRGEPMMVGLPLWGKLIGHLDRYDVLMTCVTNGTFLRRRIDERTLPVIDTLTVSIDGTSPEVFAANRGNASLDEWKRNVGYFNELRHASKLARKPRLGLSWTLKRNNIAQFPDFVRLAMDLGADLLYVRHLFVFHAKDQDQSLVSEPDLANRFLKEGYDLLQGRSIKLDAAPLSYTDASA